MNNDHWNIACVAHTVWTVQLNNVGHCGPVTMKSHATKVQRRYLDGELVDGKVILAVYPGVPCKACQSQVQPWLWTAAHGWQCGRCGNLFSRLSLSEAESSVQRKCRTHLDFDEAAYRGGKILGLRARRAETPAKLPRYDNDSRTEEQKVEFVHGVAAIDSFLSGWGKSDGKNSYAVWACRTADDALVVMSHVANRGDMRQVRHVDLRTWTKPSGSHVSVYVVGDGHRYLDPVKD